MVVAGFACGLLALPSTASANGCGVPFEGTTYYVSTATHIATLSGCDTSWDVIQTADIVMPATTSNFSPIGDTISPFRGTYDGRGHSITGLRYSNTSPSGVIDGFGLFGNAQGATIRNLQIEIGITFASAAGDVARIGGLVGNGTGITISDVEVDADIAITVTSTHDAERVGGVAGILGFSSVRDTLVRGSISVTATGSGSDIGDVGGLVGYGDDISVQQTGSAATIEVSSDAIAQNVGGLVGRIEPVSLSAIDNEIRFAYAMGSVRVTGQYARRVAGLVGRAHPNTGLEGLYTTGAVTATASAPPSGNNSGGFGGLIGQLDGPNDIRRSYATGAISATENGSPYPGTQIGGVVGRVLNGTPTATATFWNTQTTGQTSDVLTEGTTGVDTATMQSRSTFANAGWAISEYWTPFAVGSAEWGICPTVNGGYPYLLWQYDAGNAPCPAPSPTPTPSPNAAVLGIDSSGAYRRGTIRLRVTVDGPGSFTVTGKRWVKSRARALRTACSGTRTVTAAGTYTVACRLNTPSRRLLRRKALRIGVRVTFAPTTGVAASQAKTVRVKRVPSRPVPVTG